MINLRFIRDEKVSVELTDIQDRSQLVDKLRLICSDIGSGVLPFIHFEIHGCEDGFSLSNGQLVPWQTIKQEIRDINVRCRNNLFISLSTCYGAYLLGIYGLWEPCPFYGYVGPISEILVRDAENSYSAFFENLLETQNFDTAVEALRQANAANPNAYVFITCHIFFDRLVEKFNADQQNPRKFRERIKNLMMDSRASNLRASVGKKELRRRIERLLLSGHDDRYIETCKAIFLHKRAAMTRLF